MATESDGLASKTSAPATARQVDRLLEHLGPSHVEKEHLIQVEHHVAVAVEPVP